MIPTGPITEHLFCAYSLDLAAVIDGGWNLPSEFEQARQYAEIARQQQFLAGRALIRWLLCTQINPSLHPNDISVQRHANGAPLLWVAGQQWQCSISHTKGAALIAVSAQHDMGVDIEPIAVRRRQAQLIERYQHGFFAGLKATDTHRFFERWTLAEAVTKQQQGLLLQTLALPVDAFLNRVKFLTKADFQAAIYHPHHSSNNVQLLHYVG